LFFIQTDTIRNKPCPKHLITPTSKLSEIKIILSGVYKCLECHNKFNVSLISECSPNNTNEIISTIKNINIKQMISGYLYVTFQPENHPSPVIRNVRCQGEERLETGIFNKALIIF
jgi:hypothetical protein